MKVDVFHIPIRTVEDQNASVDISQNAMKREAKITQNEQQLALGPQGNSFK